MRQLAGRDQGLHIGQEGGIDSLYAEIGEIVHAQQGRSVGIAGSGHQLAGRDIDQIDAGRRIDLVPVQGIECGGQEADAMAVLVLAVPPAELDAKLRVPSEKLSGRLMDLVLASSTDTLSLLPCPST